MDKEFEDMMNELFGEIEQDELSKGMGEIGAMLETIYDELISRGFTVEQSFEFASELTIRTLIVTM